MLFLCKPFQEIKVITFQTIRDKYIEIVRLQREEKERLQNIVGLIAKNFEGSLELEQTCWGYRGQNPTENYVLSLQLKMVKNLKFSYTICCLMQMGFCHFLLVLRWISHRLLILS